MSVAELLTAGGGGGGGGAGDVAVDRRVFFFGGILWGQKRTKGRRAFGCPAVSMG